MTTHNVTVHLPKTDSRNYTIHIGNNVLPETGTICQKLKLGKKILLLTNQTVFRLYGNPVQKSLENSGFLVRLVKINDGEEFKTLKTAEQVYSIMLENNFDRSSAIVALGGGVIGDLAGFIAGTYQRGIACIQIPTTLLSQVDSSVGGKTAVNHALGKNMIGVFNQPQAVIADIATLQTLPLSELRSGLAEVIKYGLILDKDFFHYLLTIKKTTEQDLLRIVSRCCQLKADIVEQDEKEQGIRALLNFGHTFGHAIETLTHYKTYSHGIAIALGMRVALSLSTCHKELKKLDQLYTQWGLPLKLEKPLSAKELLNAMSRDKKVKDGKVRLVLLESIGSAIIKDDTDHAKILASLALIQP
jgi:3-dehydroquinate synthase